MAKRIVTLFPDDEVKPQAPPEEPAGVKQKLSPFDFINSITFNKNRELLDDETKSYNAYIVNLGLSHHVDTVFWANLMNEFFFLPPRIQHLFLFHAVRKGKRFAKWAKHLAEDETFKVVQEFFKYNERRTREVMKLLTEEDIANIKKRMNTGGVVRRRGLPKGKAR